MSENGNTTAGLEWVRLSERPPSPNGRTPKLRMVDLFCGCGGMTLGVAEATRCKNRQLDIRLAADEASEVLAVYRANFSDFGEHLVAQDVSQIFDGRLGAPLTSTESKWKRLIGSVDLVIAGPPCQGHSDLNNVTRRRDPRNRLYLRVVRATEVLAPKVLIVENVPTVLLDRQHVVAQARKWLINNGYHVSADIVPLARFALPQLRMRHVLVAVSRGEFDLSELDGVDGPPPTAGEYLAGLEDEPQCHDGILYRPTEPTDTNRRRIDYLFKHRLYELPNALRPPCHRDKYHKYISMYGRMHWDRPAQTLTSGFGSMGQGRYVHPTRRRLLTPHEAARLQGFPVFPSLISCTVAKRESPRLREMIANLRYHHSSRPFL